jgi:hypothetical protein
MVAAKANFAPDHYTGPLRTAAGELPQGCPWNRHWGLCQGEFYSPPDRTSYRVDLSISPEKAREIIAWAMGLLDLEPP